MHANAVRFLPGALRLLGVPEDDIKDVTQDVLFAAYRSLDRFDAAQYKPGQTTGSDPESDEREAQTAWLFGIAWRLVHHYFERAYRRYEVPTGLMDALYLARVDPSPGPDERIAALERLDLTSRLLDSVAPERRIILILSDAYDVPIPEIAQLLEINANTATNRLRLAREDYRAAVKRLPLEERERIFQSGLLLVPLASDLLLPGSVETNAPVVPQDALGPWLQAHDRNAGSRFLRPGLGILGRGLGTTLAGFAGATVLVFTLKPTPIPYARSFVATAAQLATARSTRFMGAKPVSQAGSTRSAEEPGAPVPRTCVLWVQLSVNPATPWMRGQIGELASQEIELMYWVILSPGSVA